MERELTPNVTPLHNLLIDQVMALVTGEEWKVICYGVRCALGPGASDEGISIAQFANGRQASDGSLLDRGTGLTEAQVKSCLDFLCDTLHLFLRQDRPRKPICFRLNLDGSSINWEALEERQASWAAEKTSEAISQATRPATKPETGMPARGRYPDYPPDDVRLDANDNQAVAAQVRSLLHGEWRKAYDELVRLYLRGRDEGTLGSNEAWALFTAWRTYGFARVTNALQDSLDYPDLAQVGRTCLFVEVLSLLEQERIGQASSAFFRQHLEELVEDNPDLKEWRYAIEEAVVNNKRNLKYIAAILKRRKEQGKGELMPKVEGVRVGRAGADRQGAKGAKRRASRWTEEELQAAREAQAETEWAAPPD
ncbi:MAG: DnaD domain protein [Chloroflexi bacterium]|nr:DnaD domain protein [Chloroflexota bacterium]